MKKKLNFCNFFIFSAIPLLMLTACVGSTKIGFTVAAADEIKSLNYLKYPKTHYNSQFLYSYVEGLFHSAPNDNAGSNEFLEMTKANNGNGIVMKELTINDSKLDFDQVITNDLNNLNQNIKTLAQNAPIISKTSSFWYGVARDVYSIKYGNNITNFNNRNAKEFIVRLAPINVDNRKLPYKDNYGVEHWQKRPALWHDLKPVTAYDFVNSLEYVLDINNGSTNIDQLTDKTKTGIKNAQAYVEAQKQSTNNAEQIKKNLGIKAIGNDLLYVNFETGFSEARKNLLINDFISKIAQPSLLPSRKDFIKKTGNLFGTSAKNSIGNGAFKIKRADFSNETIFIKNYDYWDRERINSESWKYKVVKDNFTIATLFESGEVGHADVVNSLLPRFRSNPKLRPFLSQGMSFRQSQFFAFNNNKPIFQGEAGKYLKNAISYSINRNKSLIAQNNGGAVPPDTFSTPNPTKNTNGNDQTWRETMVNNTGEPLYNITIDEKENVSVPLAYYTTIQRVFYGKQQSNIDRTDRMHQPKIAKKFLEKYLSLTKKTNIELKLLYDTSSTENVDQIIYLKQEIEQNLPELKINLRPQAKSTYLGQSNSGDFDIVHSDRTGENREPFEYLSAFSQVYYDKDKSLRYLENPSGNWQFYDYIKNKNYDQLIASNKFFQEFQLTKNEYLWLHALLTPYNDKGDNFATKGLVKNNTVNQFEVLNQKLSENLKESNILQKIFTKDTSITYPQGAGHASVSGLGSQMAPHISFRMYSIFEAIIKMESPIAVLSNSTAGWFVQRIIGNASGAGDGLPEVQWAYNCDNKPSNSYFVLKGCEVYQRQDLIN